MYYKKITVFLLGILFLSSCGDIPKKTRTRSSDMSYQISWEQEHTATLLFSRGGLEEDPRVVFIMKCCNSQYELRAKKARDGEYRIDTKSLPKGREWHILIYYKNEKIIGNMDSFNS